MKENNIYVKSPLNYVGGKYKLLSQIIPLFPTNINMFIDVFGGGFNVGINANAQKILYNELNSDVVKIIKYLYDNDTEDCLRQIDMYVGEYSLSKTNSDGYKKLRDNYNLSSDKNPLMLYTLICHAFNYQIRFNSKGEFNMPFGKERSSFNSVLRSKFELFCNQLHQRDIIFSNKDFRFFSEFNFNHDDFLYCDPPYLNSTATYNENNGWNGTDENELLTMLETVNVKWALSNNFKTNPNLKKWAEKNGFVIHYLNGGYGNCNYHKKDNLGDIEVLITNYKNEKTKI